MSRSTSLPAIDQAQGSPKLKGELIRVVGAAVSRVHCMQQQPMQPLACSANALCIMCLLPRLAVYFSLRSRDAMDELLKSPFLASPVPPLTELDAELRGKRGPPACSRDSLEKHGAEPLEALILKFILEPSAELRKTLQEAFGQMRSSGWMTGNPETPGAQCGGPL